LKTLYEKLKTLLFCFAASLLLSSCASVFSKSSYYVKIDSDPPGAPFIIKDKNDFIVNSGTTPKTVKVRSSDGYFDKAWYLVEFTAPDSSVYRHPITFHVDGWYFLNIYSNFFGWVLVDPLTGSMYTIDKEKIKAKLD